MKYPTTKYYRNIAILTAVFAFSVFGFIGNAETVNAETETNFAPTPKKKTTLTPRRSTPTPKKAKATPKPTPKKSNQKTTAKTKPTPSRNSRVSKTTTTKKPSTNTRTSTTKKPATTSKTTTKKPAATTKTTTTKTTKPTISKMTPTTAQKTITLQKIVINSSSVAVRSSATPTASEITRAMLGSVYPVVEKKSGWYRIQLANQKSGWIPTASGINSSADNEEIYRQILAKNYKTEKPSFIEAVEVYEFLTRIQPEIKTTNTAAEFGLKRLMTLGFALDAIPSGKAGEKLYQDFLKTQNENIVFSEPTGAWYVRAPLFWDLHSKYTNTPTGEQIAWEGAKTPLPGECEGYVNCHIFLLRMTDGEYLNYYPNGKNSAQALTNIINFLTPVAADADAKKVYNGPTDVSDRAEFNSLITELRVILSRMPNVEKEKALQQLKKIAEAFK